MWKRLIISILVLISLIGFSPQRLNADEKIIPLTVDQYINNIFGSQAKVAKAVLTHESGLKLDAVNYNCFYDRKSKPCKKQDRSKAWSVDCGISQINYKGKTCPANLLTLPGNMLATKQVYDSQGLDAWVSFSSGAYKRYL